MINNLFSLAKSYPVDDTSLNGVFQPSDFVLFDSLKKSFSNVFGEDSSISPFEDDIYLPKGDENDWGGVLVGAADAVKPRGVFTSKYAPLFEYLYVLLPLYLNSKWNVEYNTSSAVRILERHRYDSLIDDAIDCVSPLHCSAANRIMSKLHLLTPKKGNDLVLNNVPELSTLLYERLSPRLKRRSEKELIYNFHKVYTYKDRRKASEPLQYLLTIASLLPNLVIRRYVKSINVLQNRQEYKFLEARYDMRTLAKAIFNTANPKQKAVEDLAKRNPEKYKEWRKKRLLTLRRAKRVISEQWTLKDLPELVDVEKVRDLCERIGLNCPVDDGFVGFISLGKSSHTLFRYHTLSGKELASPVGLDVVMNPKYDPEKDNTYVCTSLPASGVSDVRYRYYTKAYQNKKTGQRYDHISKVNSRLEDIRYDIQEDIERHDLSSVSLAATVIRLIDVTAASPGALVYVKDEDAYGISTLKVKHIEVLPDVPVSLEEDDSQEDPDIFEDDGSRIRISYIGRNKVSHEYIITDSLLTYTILMLIKDRGPEDYVFSATGKRPLTTSYINSYLKRIGFPGSTHTWRRYHANRVFRQTIHEGKEAYKRALSSSDTSPPRIDVNKLFQQAVEATANKLQVSKNVCISRYLDAVLMMDVYKDPVLNSRMIKPPKTVQVAFDRRHAKEIDELGEDLPMDDISELDYTSVDVEKGNRVFSL